MLAALNGLTGAVNILISQSADLNTLNSVKMTKIGFAQFMIDIVNIFMYCALKSFSLISTTFTLYE